MSTQPQQAQKLEKVSLLKDHTHAGTPYAKGDTIEVNSADKQWLIDREIIAAPIATAPATATATAKE